MRLKSGREGAHLSSLAPSPASPLSLLHQLLALGHQEPMESVPVGWGERGVDWPLSPLLSNLEIFGAHVRKKSQPPPHTKPAILEGGRKGNVSQKSTQLRCVSLICTSDGSLEKAPSNVLGKAGGANGQDEDGRDVHFGGAGHFTWSAASALRTGVEGRYFCVCPPTSPHSTSLKSLLTHHCRELPFLAELSHSQCESAVNLAGGWALVPTFIHSGNLHTLQLSARHCSGC